MEVITTAATRMMRMETITASAICPHAGSSKRAIGEGIDFGDHGSGCESACVGHQCSIINMLDDEYDRTE